MSQKQVLHDYLSTQMYMLVSTHFDLRVKIVY